MLRKFFIIPFSYLIIFQFLVYAYKPEGANSKTDLNLNIYPISFSDTLYIALSKASGNNNYLKYVKWLKSFDKSIVIIDMIKKKPQEAVTALEKCSALLLTGGPDVDPPRYGKAKDSSRCELDRHRDTLEFALIKKAMQLNLPILGICRGEQILNIAMGGSLIIDIPTDHDTLVRHQSKEKDHIKHYVSLVPGTFLYQVCHVIGDTIISNHHQAVDKLADCFKVSAWAKDSIIEAFEWKYPNKQFLLAVQWHPEKLEPYNDLSIPIAKYFISEARKYKASYKSKQ